MKSGSNGSDEFHDSISCVPRGVSFKSFTQVVKTPVAQQGWFGLRGELHRYLKIGKRHDHHAFHAHDETVFRFLLANECRRSERTGHSFHLLLLYFAGPDGDVTWMDGNARDRLLPALSSVVRETDYIGWYRDEHVVGGVLTPLSDRSTRETFRRIEQRLSDGLEGNLHVGDFARLRLGVFQSHDLRVEDSLDHTFTFV